MIYLHTLGSALISIGVKEIRPTSPMFFAALLYLGMERGRRVPRTALQEMLFPDVDERSGAHSLRQLLYKLRQLGTSLSEDASGALLDANEVAVDLSAVPDLARTQPDRLALGFLPGYVPQFSETFSEWLDRKRAFAEAEIRRALVTRLIQHRDSAQWPQVERVAQLLLGIDPYNEEATLALAEATAMAGSKAEALRILDRYEHEAGSHDLKLPASVLRRRISDRLPPSLLIARPPFVGRAEEAQALLEQVRNRLNGTGGVLVITGEPGIGKTRLMEETLAVAMLDGVKVYTARCKPHDVKRPMSALTELAPLLLQARGALGISPESLSHLSLLTKHKDDRVDRPIDARDDVTRSRAVVAAFHDLVDAVLTEQRLLIVVEDIQWCDAESLSELSSMGAALNKPLVVVLTARVLDATARELLLSREAVLHKMPPLSKDGLEELARNLVPAFRECTSDDTTLEWYVQHAAGNPLFLRMLCADFLTNRPFHVPSDLVALATSRIERLSPLSRRILELSALLGRHSTKIALRELAECTSTELLDAVQTLEEEGFLQLHGDSYAAHDLIAECALRRLRPATLSLLHDCVGRWLEGVYDQTHEAGILWDCAEQWLRSGDRLKAIHFLKRCAQHALHIGRAGHALILLERAYGLADDAEHKVDICSELVLAARANDQWPVVWDASRRLAEANSGEPLDHTSVELLSIEAEFERTFSAPAACEKLLQCLHTAKASTSHRLQAAISLFRIAHECGLTDLAHDTYSAIEPLLGANGSSSENQTAALIYHTSFGDRERALHIARSLQLNIEQCTYLPDYLRTGRNTAVAMSVLGVPHESIQLLLSLHDRAKRLGLLEWQFELAADLCWAYLDREQTNAAKLWYEVCASLAPSVRMGPKTLVRHAAAECEIALRAGDTQLAEIAYSRMAETVPAESVRARIYVAMYPIRWRLRDPLYASDEAEVAELQRLHGLSRQFTGFGFTVVALAEALCRANKTDKARQVICDYMEHQRHKRSSLAPSLAALADRLRIGLPSSDMTAVN